MKRKIYENGRSLKIALPRAYTELVGIKPGDEVEVTVKNNTIVLYKPYCE